MSEHPINPDDVARDPALDRAYRAAADEEPPARLDDAIRAAARREVGARPQPAGGSGLRRWRVPVSIAAMVVVGASVVTLMRDEQPALLESPANKVLPPASAPAAQADAAPAREKLQSEMANAPASDKAKADRAGKLEGDGQQPGKEQAYLESTVSKDAAAKKREAPELDRSRTLMGGVVGQPAPAAREEAARADAQRDSREPASPPSAAANVAGRVQEPERRSAQAYSAPEARPADAPPAVAPAPKPEPVRPPPVAEAKVVPRAEPLPSVAADAPMRQRSAEGSVAADSIAQAAPKPAPPPPPAPRPALKPAPREIQPAPAPDAAVAPLQKSTVDADYAGLDTPEKWVARLRELRKQGRLDEASRTFAEFRKRYPQYVLPVDLQDGIRP
jgi:hypothetical protein